VVKVDEAAPIDVGRIQVETSFLDGSPVGGGQHEPGVTPS
jgi:hypothetical protein